MDMAALPEALASTLERMVTQLDLVAQTVSILEERVTMNEDKYSHMERTLQQIVTNQQMLLHMKQQSADSEAPTGAVQVD